MKIGIIGGAGTVGSCTAYALAFQSLASEIVLIDLQVNIAANHATDISASVVGNNPVSVKAGSFQDLSGAEIVIIAAGLHYAVSSPLKDRLLQNISNIGDIAQNIEKVSPAAVIITVTNPSDIMNYVVYQATELPRERIIGYNLNDTIRFRMITAKTLGISPQRVECLAGGYHPLAQVMFFSSLKVDGQIHTLTRNQKEQIQTELLGYLRAFDAFQAGRTAGWTTASGLCRLVTALKSNQPTTMPCSAILQREYGYRDIGLGVPVMIGNKGIESIEEWTLPDDEKYELEKVAAMIEPNCQLVRESIKSKRISGRC